MTMRLIPHAAAMTEFITDPTDGVRYTGTCGETAGLALAHVVDPARFPLNAATLAQIARWEINKHQASANGSEPLSSIASWMAADSIAHTNYGYGEPFTPDWRGMLLHWGGIKPIVFEYAHAAHLPGDEAGVAYHFNCCLGWDPVAQVGLFADGDNLIERQGGTALVRYSEADLVAAGICGMLVGEYELVTPAAVAPAPAVTTASLAAQLSTAHEQIVTLTAQRNALSAQLAAANAAKPAPAPTTIDAASALLVALIAAQLKKGSSAS